MKLLADQLLDIRSHGIVKDLGGAQMSLALCGLVTEVVAMIGVIHLYFAGSGYGESFCRRLMRFDLAHILNPFG
jgi:hypothetical protein